MLGTIPLRHRRPAFSAHIDLSGPELIDLTPYLREDILLNLPPHPHCDREGGRVCPVKSQQDADAESPKKGPQTGARWIS